MEALSYRRQLLIKARWAVSLSSVKVISGTEEIQCRKCGWTDIWGLISYIKLAEISLLLAKKEVSGYLGQCPEVACSYADLVVTEIRAETCQGSWLAVMTRILVIKELYCKHRTMSVYGEMGGKSARFRDYKWMFIFILVTGNYLKEKMYQRCKQEWISVGMR